MSTELAFELLPAKDQDIEEMAKVDQLLAEVEASQQELVQI